MASHPLGAILRRFAERAPTAFGRLFERERAVPTAWVVEAIGEDGLEHLSAAGLAQVAGDGVAPVVRVDRVASLVLASDRRRHRLQRDFVLGPGPASFHLARRVHLPARGPLLDLGTGCGSQGLLLADPSTEVVGVDINARAVEFARFNGLLNDRPRFRAEVGDFLGAVPDRGLDRRFGTVVANPPFVLSPANEVTYRDRPLPADEVGARTVERVTRALARDGRGYVLCNWIDRGGGPDGPAHAWARAAGAEALVTRLSTKDPLAYAEVWTRDLAEADRAAAAHRWADALRGEGIEQIHVGIIELTPRRRFVLSRPGLAVLATRRSRGAAARPAAAR